MHVNPRRREGCGVGDGTAFEPLVQVCRVSTFALGVPIFAPGVGTEGRPGFIRRAGKEVMGRNGVSIMGCLHRSELGRNQLKRRTWNGTGNESTYFA